MLILSFFQLLTEFAGGGSLDRMIKNSIPVPLDTVRVHTTQILDALSYLHDKAVTHKDLRVRTAETVTISGIKEN